MQHIEPPFYIAIDNSWMRLIELNTGGSRDKSVFLAPTKETFYFKTSMENGRKNYTFEFWSEIVAAKLGQLLNLNVLDYNIASVGDKIGCISKNMIRLGEEELVEGVNFIIEFEPDFKDFCRNSHHISKIERALNSVGLIEYKRLVVEMILFDCIIGNTDRHSENWALIRSKIGENFYSEIMNQSFFKRMKTFWYIHKQTGFPFSQIPKLLALGRYRFAPFYDNGSSLGRELDEQKIQELIENEDKFLNFHSSRKGKSDIIVSNEKTSFLETIDFLIEHYPIECTHFINNHLSKYNKTTLKTLVNNIDFRYPSTGFERYRISHARKLFMVKLIDARINFIYDTLSRYGK